VKFAFIAAKKAEHTVSLLCRCLRVTRSGFYAWQRRPESAHAQHDRRLRVLVRASFDASRQRYGSPRILADLLEQQITISPSPPTCSIARLTRRRPISAGSGTRRSL
jgi:hypothetical protein